MAYQWISTQAHASTKTLWKPKQDTWRVMSVAMTMLDFASISIAARELGIPSWSRGLSYVSEKFCDTWEKHISFSSECNDQA